MLANRKPKSLVSASDVHIGKVMSAGNRSEFHHLFPQAYLKKNGFDANQINCLANFCIISASDNKKIGSKAPSEYKSKLSPSVVALLDSHVVPQELFADDFTDFLRKRSDMLVDVAYGFMNRQRP
jgi:hypothetical protein